MNPELDFKKTSLTSIAADSNIFVLIAIRLSPPIMNATTYIRLRSFTFHLVEPNLAGFPHSVLFVSISVLPSLVT